MPLQLMVVVWAFTLGRKLPTTLSDGNDPAPSIALKPKCVVGLGLPSDLIAALQERYEVMHWSKSFAMPDATLRGWLADARVCFARSTPITGPVIESAANFGDLNDFRRCRPY